MLKWIVAALALVNAGLFLWATGHRGLSGGDAAARQIINPDAMRLLSEVSPRTPAPSSDSPRLCFRVGPFLDRAQMERAGQNLDELQVPFHERTVPAREIRAHRVYVGPYTTPTAIAAQRKLLNASGITDHYVKRENGGQDVISLGLFSQKTGAEALLKDLQAKNIKAQIRVEDRELAPTYWIELRDSAANQRVETALRQRRWDGARAKIRQYPCV